MRPKIQGDTFYFPTPEGVYLRNNQQAQVIKGRDTSRLLDILTPYLNGHYTLDEITSTLSPAKREAVYKLITLLVGKGFIKDLALDLPHHLTPAEELAYEAEIAFIGSFTSSAEYHFERYRHSRILLIGSGLTLTALVHAHLQSGLKQVNVMLTDECTTDVQRLHDYLRLYQKRDDQQSVHEIARPAWSKPETVRPIIQRFDAIVHISDRPMLARAALLNRLCLQEHRPLLQAVIVGQSAWSGPSFSANSSGCWECAWRRLQANQPAQQAYALRDTPDAPVSNSIAAPTAAVVANQLGFELLKQITGAGPLETTSHLIETNLETLQSDRYRFLPHPHCEACQQPVPPTPDLFQQSIDRLIAGPTIEQEQFSKNSTALFDSKLGLFSELEEKDFVQIPLNIAQVTISNPMLCSNLVEPLRAVAPGTDFGMPRRRATQLACEMYASQLYDPRRLLTGTACAELLHTAEFNILYTRQLRHAHTPEPDDLYTWGYILNTGGVCVLPAQTVFTGPASPGIASGQNWAEAVSRGLLAQCKYLTIAEIASRKEPFARIDLANTPLDETGQRYRHMCEIMKLSASVYEVTGATGIPVFAFLLDGETIAYTCHADIQQALREGLEALLQYVQSSTNGQPAYAPSAVASLPAALRGSQSCVPRSSLEADWSWSTLQTRLLDALESQGQHAVAVPLHQDAALAAAFPYIVRILVVARSA
ncbi:MAG TPA: TOMM precursor leader peptide-binding protein [Ktedonobacteraceae bacterium]|nr:TOMM precursor leader peptide-binding protein [Ktedonobacteraceae bacterium]